MPRLMYNCETWSNLKAADYKIVQFNSSLVYDKDFVSTMKTGIPKFCDEPSDIKDAIGH